MLNTFMISMLGATFMISIVIFKFVVGLFLFLSKARSKTEAYEGETFKYYCPESRYRGSIIFNCKKFEKFNYCICFTYIELTIASYNYFLLIKCY